MNTSTEHKIGIVTASVIVILGIWLSSYFASDVLAVLCGWTACNAFNEMNPRGLIGLCADTIHFTKRTLSKRTS